MHIRNYKLSFENTNSVFYQFYLVLEWRRVLVNTDIFYGNYYWFIVDCDGE